MKFKESKPSNLHRLRLCGRQHLGYDEAFLVFFFVHVDTEPDPGFKNPDFAACRTVDTVARLLTADAGAGAAK